MATSTTPSPEMWNWDWCNRPSSALPADRVESLLSKFDEAISSSSTSTWGRGRSGSLPNSKAKTAANSGGRSVAATAAAGAAAAAQVAAPPAKTGAPATGATAANNDIERGVDDGKAVVTKGVTAVAVKALSSPTGLAFSKNRSDDAAAAVDDGGVATAATGYGLSRAGSSSKGVVASKKGPPGERSSESTSAVPEETELGSNVSFLKDKIVDRILIGGSSVKAGLLLAGLRFLLQQPGKKIPR